MTPSVPDSLTRSADLKKFAPKYIRAAQTRANALGNVNFEWNCGSYLPLTIEFNTPTSILLIAKTNYIAKLFLAKPDILPEGTEKFQPESFGPNNLNTPMLPPPFIKFRDTSNQADPSSN